MALTIPKDSNGRIIPGVESALQASGYLLTEDNNALTVFIRGRIHDAEDEAVAQAIIDAHLTATAKSEAIAEKRAQVIGLLEKRISTLLGATEQGLDDYGFRVLALMLRAIFVANPTLTKPAVIKKLIDLFEKAETELSAMNSAQDWRAITEKDVNAIQWPW